MTLEQKDAKGRYMIKMQTAHKRKMSSLQNGENEMKILQRLILKDAF